MRRFGLRDDQWERIKHLLPGREGSVGVTATDNRLFVEAVLYRYRTGMPWRDLPERFGDGVKVHLRFSRWAKSGVWERVFQYLAADADNEYANVVGYGRLIGRDDAGTLERLRTIRRDLIDPANVEFGGNVRQTAGDSWLIVFDSLDGAVRCAVKIQQNLPVLDGNRPEDERIRLRIGVNIGDVIPDGTDLHGDGVNIATRLQEACPIGGVCVPRVVRDHLRDRLPLDFEPLGALRLKNIARPVEAFSIRLGPGPSSGALTKMVAHRRRPPIVGFAVAIVILVAGVGWWLSRRGETVATPMLAPQALTAPFGGPARFTPPAVGLAQAPPLSVVVLPFTNLGGDASQDYLADGITEDLTTDLARIQGMLVIARNSAFTYKGRAVDARRIGEELGVRYVVEGSVRRIGNSLRVNAQLISTETGTHLWANRFDTELKDIAAQQDEIVALIGQAMNVQLIDIESGRAARERPSNPDAFDLILQAHALTNQPPSPTRDAAAQALYERALGLDPSSVPAILGIADLILSRTMGFLNLFVPTEEMEHAVSLLERARAANPRSEHVMVTSALLSQARGEWDELGTAARVLTEHFPNLLIGYELLATAQRYTGHPDDAVGLYQKSIRLDPRSPSLFLRYGFLGFALLQVGRYDEAVTWFARSLEANPEAPVVIRSARMRLMAIGLALGGRLEEARRVQEQATALWPFATVRASAPENLSSDALRADIRRLMDGARLTGLRDHADEDADFGVTGDAALHADFAGYTPTSSPRFATIHTRELAELIAQRQPLVIDAMAWWWGVSLPGAVGLRKGGIGGRLDDTAQAQLQRKVLALTAGDLARPVVAVGWNSESFDGYNLALRLTAMGFKEVFWYRGGRESWEAAGMTVAESRAEMW